MLRRLLYRPLYILFTEDNWAFCGEHPRFRHNIKILMTVTQLKKYDQQFHPGVYEVRMQWTAYRPALVFLPLRK